MLPSKKFFSMPIVSLKEGLQIGYVRNLVIDPKSKAVAAFVVDPKGFFKDQRIIPFNRVANIGENAITVSTESQVQKATNLPDILQLLKEKSAVIGIKVMTEGGKTLGVVEEFHINASEGTIASLDIVSGKLEGFIGGKARMLSQDITTMGSDVIIVAKDCEERLTLIQRGLPLNVKSFFEGASAKVSSQGQKMNAYLKGRVPKKHAPKGEEGISDPEAAFDQADTMMEADPVHQVSQEVAAEGSFQPQKETCSVETPLPASDPLSSGSSESVELSASDKVEELIQVVEAPEIPEALEASTSVDPFEKNSDPSENNKEGKLL